MDSPTLLWALLVLLQIFSIQCKTKWTDNPIEKPLAIASFNIQNLGNSKLSNKTIIDIVKQIILRYDLVFIQEIVTMDEKMMTNFVKDLNKLTDRKNQYKMEISERLGRGTAKEQYAYIYRAARLTLIKSQVYPDHEDLFMRPPFIAHFSTPTLKDTNSLLMIGVHTQPKNAANETSSMATVYDYAVETFKVENAILMGDMNAACSNVRQSDWQWIELWQRPEFFWLIGHDMDTTAAHSCCPYDRIVTAGMDMEEAVIWDSIKAFNFRQEYGLISEMALAISDHWPVEVKLRGGTSESVHQNLKPSLCVSVDDKRPKTVPDEILNQKTTYGFNIQVTETMVMLRSQTSDDETLLTNLQKVVSRYPDFLSQEAVQTILYKVEHGALDDRTSHTDIEKELYAACVTFDRSSKTTTVEFCADTTVN